MLHIFILYILLEQYNGLITLPDRYLDPDLGTDIHPKNGYSNDLGSESVQWEQFLQIIMVSLDRA